MRLLSLHVTIPSVLLYFHISTLHGSFPWAEIFSSFLFPAYRLFCHFSWQAWRSKQNKTTWMIPSIGVAWEKLKWMFGKWQLSCLTFKHFALFLEYICFVNNEWCSSFLFLSRLSWCTRKLAAVMHFHRSPRSFNLQTFHHRQYLGICSVQIVSCS